jgi:deoxyxylulose-5-phosphate synthase
MILIENRLINEKMIIELSKEVEKYIIFEEQYTLSGKVVNQIETGKWFSTVFLLGAEPIFIIRDSELEVKEEMARIKKRLESYFF